MPNSVRIRCTQQGCRQRCIPGVSTSDKLVTRLTLQLNVGFGHSRRNCPDCVRPQLDSDRYISMFRSAIEPIV
ncbi:hypothetical protein AHF37_01892 [Paragonimus kellicotti]|nr:hypothetical protein AHF37_01892 [Paragonimus kellicotti]